MKEAKRVQVENLLIEELKPDPANPRRIEDEELESLTRSIREFGLVEPIIARKEDRQVIGGHQRLLAARRLVDLTLSGFSEDELKKHLKGLESREKRERIETFDLEVALEATRASSTSNTNALTSKGGQW